MFSLADRMNLVSESITLAVSAKAAAMKKAGIDVVGFGAGEPDFDTPTFIKEAAKTALDKGQTKYTPTPCIPDLRAAIADKFNRENNLPYKPENITTGAGGKHCLYMAFMAVLNPGDEVLIPSPYWVSYPEQVKLAGGVPKVIRGEEKNGFRITPQQLENAITPKSKVLIINSPSNPAGHAYTADELKALADVVVKHPNLIVFSDEIYEKLVYGGLKFVSFATLHPQLIEQTLTFNCHSKSFAMTGWRVGYIGGPKPAIDAINKLQSQMTSHITSFCQMPAAIALTDPRARDTIEQMRQQFEKRGAHMHARLTALPKVTCVKPQGAFYAFPNITGTGLSSASIAARLLAEAGVAALSGTAFGPQGEGFLRFSYANSVENIQAALEAIRTVLA
jgi:aspartate aminotransferase